jgi:hypothetical protein
MANVTLKCNRNYAKLVDAIQNSLATKVDLCIPEISTFSGRSAGSRIVQNAKGEYILA